MSLFIDAVKTGRSLVFVQTLRQHDQVRAALKAARIPYVSTYEWGALNALVKYDGLIGKTKVLLATVPALTSGCAIRADRTIWFRGDSYSHTSSFCAQAMCRVREPYAQRLYMDEGEIS